jgi:hypothetical protein
VLLFNQEELLHQFKIDTAKTYKELSLVAIDCVQRMQNFMHWNQHFPDAAKLGIVCGPISTGGKGSIVANIAHFELAVQSMTIASDGGFFSQIPFEEAIWRIKAADEAAVGKTMANKILLLEFYLPLFRSGWIQEMHFLPDWASSDGATWERHIGFLLGFDIYDLDEQFRPTLVIAA